MDYCDPSLVISPQSAVEDVRPIVDREEGDWAAALLLWDGEPRVAMRWNGSRRHHPSTPHPGTPQSRGFPTWFIIPCEPPEVSIALLQTFLDEELLGGGRIDKAQATQRVQDELIRLRNIS